MAAAYAEQQNESSFTRLLAQLLVKPGLKTATRLSCLATAAAAAAALHKSILSMGAQTAENTVPKTIVGLCICRLNPEELSSQGQGLCPGMRSWNVASLLLHQDPALELARLIKDLQGGSLHESDQRVGVAAKLRHAIHRHNAVAHPPDAATQLQEALADDAQLNRGASVLATSALLDEVVEDTLRVNDADDGGVHGQLRGALHDCDRVLECGGIPLPVLGVAVKVREHERQEQAVDPLCLCQGI